MPRHDQYTVVLEDLRDQFKGFGEALQFVHKDIKEIKKTLGCHEKILNSHTATLNSHTEMIGQLMVDMTEVKNGLKTKVSQDDFARLEKRVVRLETKVR